MKILGVEIPSLSIDWGRSGDRLWWQRCNQSKLSGKTFFLVAVHWKDVTCTNAERPGVCGRYRGLEVFAGPMKLAIFTITVDEAGIERKDSQ